MTTVTGAVHRDPDILGGKPVFVGTRVPFQMLVDYIATGHTLDTFLDHFRTVRREQALRALEDARDSFGPRRLPVDEGVPRPLVRALAT